MKKLLSAALGASILMCSVAVAAVAPDSIAVTGAATSGGTKAKPKAVSASFANTADGANAERATTPESLNWKWTGIKDNGGAFPKCSAETIDAAQSDDGCPKGSLVATGAVSALLGPDSGDQSAAAAVTCEKQLKVYNNGAGKSTLFVIGDPAACAGLTYLPPVALTSTKTSTGEEINFPVPGNLQAPLPGLRGSIIKLSLTYKKMTVTKGKKKIGYLTSTGCKGQRKITFRTGFANYDDSVVSSNAGKC